MLGEPENPDGPGERETDQAPFFKFAKESLPTLPRPETRPPRRVCGAKSVNTVDELCFLWWGCQAAADAEKQRLARDISSAGSRITGIPEERILVAITDVSARFIVEGGRFLPEPGLQARFLPEPGLEGDWLPVNHSGAPSD